MPGDSPHEAVQAFLEPLRDAVAVLDGVGHIGVGRRGGYALGEVYAWALNGGEGMVLRGLGRFDAGMRFAVVEADPAKHEGRYRVTTRAYRYSLWTPEHGVVWRMDWHPDSSVSPEPDPHLHLLPDLDRKLPYERMTFEMAIRWCMAFGAGLSCSPDEAENVLAGTEGPHKLYRSWSVSPTEPH